MGCYEKVDGAIIVGGGPSGLAVSACLKENGVPSVILERSDCIGSLWQQKTYDRLKLHLPKHFCEIPLLGFPETFPKYPTKSHFISYLESYAGHFSIRPIFNQLVLSAHPDPTTGLWTVRTHDRTYVSRWLVVATGENADPVFPDIQGIDKFRGKVVHTSEYRSGFDYRNQRVLVVGCGNSGMEVSLDLCSHNATPHIVVRNAVHILPKEMFGISTFEIGMKLVKWMPLWVVDKFLITVANFTLGNTERLGLRRPKAGPLHLKNVTGKSPVLDAGALSEIRAGKIKVMEGIKEITENGAKFMDGKEMEFDSIILATGYKSNVPTWLKGSDFFTRDGLPKVPFPEGWKGGNGLYTVGFTRRGIQGVASDAVKIGRDIADQYFRVYNEIQEDDEEEEEEEEEKKTQCNII